MIQPLGDKSPRIDESVYLAPTATVIGDVEIAKNASIWFETVIRGDINPIRIGEFTNIQDFCMLHISQDSRIIVGDYVTVGHRALLHGCKIGNNCLIGMGAIIMDNADVGNNCIIGAGSLVTQNQKIPDGSLVFGSPARVKRSLMPEEIEEIKKSAEHYFEYSRRYVGVC